MLVVTETVAIPFVNIINKLPNSPISDIISRQATVGTTNSGYACVQKGF